MAATSKPGQYKVEGATVPLGLATLIATIDVSNERAASSINIQVQNDTLNPFDDFFVKIRTTADSDYFEINGQSSDFTTPVLPLRFATKDPMALTSLLPVVLQYDCRGIDAIQIFASNATAAGEASVYWTFGVG